LKNFTVPVGITKLLSWKLCTDRLIGTPRG
jgi:hypothetical protein